MHLDEEQVQRLLHGELLSGAEASAREHLAGCVDCRRRVTEAEQEEDEVYALLGTVDDPPPHVSAGAIAARARAPDFTWVRRVAAVLLAVGVATAAYAVPGSPLPRWVGAFVGWVGGRQASPPSARGPMQAPEPRVAGIAVSPGQRLVILFTSPQAEGRARVSLTDGTEVVVRAPPGAAAFTSGVDQLVIDDQATSPTFEIQIPRAAPWIEIRVGGDRIFLKEGPRVTARASGDSTGAAGFYSLPLAPP